ncbi:DHH family phosphoesterase [Lachnospiraceae bacterium NSJ-143]|nr:DHH family phosphoesterase [Lachnospiraceae bacterium NSJ-143]
MKGTDKNILQGFKPLWLIGSAAVLALAAAVVYFMPIIFVFIMLSCGIAAIAAAAVMRFFGGSCGDEDEKEMIGAVKKAVENSSVVYLMGHRRADFDSFGACAGMGALCRRYGKPYHLVVGDDIFAIKDIYDKFLTGGDYSGVFVKASQAEKYINESSLLIVCDTHVSRLVESYELIKKAGNTIVLDHHNENGDCIQDADRLFVKPYYSSTCELVAALLKNTCSEPNQLEAEALLAGIMVDTRNFGMNTGEHVFSTAAYLCRCGADSASARMLFKSTMNLERAKANAVESSKMYKKGIIFSICDGSHRNIYLACARAADELLDIKGVEASIVLCRYAGTVFVSARSNGRIDVDSILKKVGGGGHLNMAGVQFEGKDIQSVDKMLKDAVDKYLMEVK